MKLEITNGLVSLVGKWKELELIEKTLEVLIGYIDDGNHHAIFDNSDIGSAADVGFSYDMDCYTVDDIKDIWRRNKKEILNRVKKGE